MYKLYSHPSEQGGRRVSRKQPSSTIRKKPTDDKKLEVAVDHVLLEHQGKLPKKKTSQLRVTRRDSYSTISTDPGFPDTNLCHVLLDERNGGFIPLEISFPSADADYSFPLMPLLQKSKVQRLPDSRNVFDFYDDQDDNRLTEDITFVPADTEAASVTSSMEVVRKISSRYTKSDDIDEILSKAAARASSTTQYQKSSNSNNRRGCGMRRVPSMGMDGVGTAPPLRRGMNELSFCVRRAEF
ncbi:hypothetical protein IV203_008603 [Nitzschia inconspicua]|uniref:Uncharacterized protein n=1 Tax=Nitzschia inconspicua TaxID=303405 RepID=A0A9K3PM49_9STRA|nr:hypothetical protein IV203_008603 [Nitzschia inconspicua]